MASLQHSHWLFDSLLRQLESRSVSRERLTEMLLRLAIAAPQPLSTSEIARMARFAGSASLAPEGVRRASAALKRLNLVSELEGRGRSGRPSILLKLGGQQWATVGVKIGHKAGRPVSLNVLVTGLDGEPLDIAGYQSREEPYETTIPEGDDLVHALGTAVEEICCQPATEGLYILGVGVEVAGHAFEGRVVEASHTGMKGEQLDLKLSQRLQGLARRLDRLVGRSEPLPVVVDNDVNVLAVLETYKPRSRDRHIVIIAVFDDGIGAALVIDGRVYRGSRGMAGEFGHCLVPVELDVQDQSEHPDYPGFSTPCHCGRSQHLDCYATPVRILGHLGETDFAATSRRSATNNGASTAAGNAFAKAGQALGISIASLVNVLNPSRLVLFLPPPLVRPEPGTCAAAYSDEIRNMVRTHAFSDAAEHTPISVHAMNADERRFLGAKSAALRVVDSFIEHAKKHCRCYNPPPDQDMDGAHNEWRLL